MSVMQDFKKFAMRGNVLDMAIGVIIGAAFGKVIASLAQVSLLFLGYRRQRNKVPSLHISAIDLLRGPEL